MKLEQSFEVDAPLERVWQTLIDVEHVAPCLPGASVTGRNDDGSYTGTFTVKIGPTTASYTGKLEMETIDEASHSATMQASGTDKRGQGGAKATIFSRLATVDGRGTRVEVVTDYHITGRLARFGRGGMIEDISERLLREFAKRLQTSLIDQHATLVSEAPAAPAAPEPEAPAASAAPEPEAPAVPPAVEPETPSVPAAPEPEPTRDHTVFAQVPIESLPPEEPVSPTAETWPPPPAQPPADEITPPRPGYAPTEPMAVPEPADPAIAPPPTEPEAPPTPAEPIPVASVPEEPPAPPPPPSPGPPPVMTPPPAPEAPPAPPAGATRPPLEHPPSEPLQGLTLVGGVIWSRVKRNPAPAAAAGAAVLLLMARRRRRRH